MKNIKYIILLLLIVLVAIIAFLIGKGNTKTELVYVDKVIEKEVEVEVEKEVVKYVEVDSVQTDSLKLSSDVYENQQVYSRGTKIIDGKNVFIVDVISKAFYDTQYPGAVGTVINKSTMTRNYLITEDTCIAAFPDDNCLYDKDIVFKPAERSNQLLQITTNSKGEIIKVFIPGP